MCDFKKFFKRRKIKKPEQVRNILSFLSIAYKDYIASRVLFNNDLLSQACILANTAIEKYFKAIINVRNNKCSGHNVGGKLFRTVSNYDKKLGRALNKEFLQFLSWSYEMRYLDDLPVGFNIVIVRDKILAELDYTVAEIYRRFSFSKDGKKIELPYQKDVENRQDLLWKNNYILNGQTKARFLNRENSVYEMRVIENKKIIEAKYRIGIGKVLDDGIFLKEALKPKNDNKD